jgi:hypothetical protein
MKVYTIIDNQELWGTNPPVTADSFDKAVNYIRTDGCAAHSKYKRMPQATGADINQVPRHPRMWTAHFIWDGVSVDKTDTETADYIIHEVEVL